jgi:hypothetical protein
MTEPLRAEQLASIREQVQKVHDGYRAESASAADVSLAMDTQILLDAYDRLRAENAAFRPIVEAVAEKTVLMRQDFESVFFARCAGRGSKIPRMHRNEESIRKLAS